MLFRKIKNKEAAFSDSSNVFNRSNVIIRIKHKYTRRKGL